jgi:hypothetical protein
MRTRRLLTSLLTIVCSWPVVTRAAEMAIPELGIHLVDMPVGVEKPGMKRRVDGCTATLHIGTATLKIDRFEEAVPSGSDIKNETFRAAQEPPSYALHPHARGQATTVDGHAAWTSTFAFNAGAPGGKDVLYTSVTYALVDQHLYSFAAREVGGDTPPSDFVAAVRAISDLTFSAVDRSAMSDSEPPSGLIRMPYFDPSTKDWYPAAAKRRRETGVVDLEFSLDGRGRARDVQQIYAATDELGASSRSLLTDVTFHLAPGWEAKGYQKLRFTIEVQYLLTGSGHPCAPPPVRVPDAQQVVICSSL